MMATTTIAPAVEGEGPKRSRKRRVSWLLAVCIIASAAYAGWWSVRQRQQRASAAARLETARWTTPELRNLETNVSATGIVRLKTGAEVRVGAQLSGIVRRLNVTVGSKVAKGDVIAEVDSRPVRARIGQAESQLAQSEAALAKSQTDYSRTEKLFAAGLVAAQQMDDARAAREAARAAVTAAQSNLQAAKVDLAYVEIRAPISGTIASISTQQGETVAASFATPTFVTIIQSSALEVVAMVDEADIGNVRPGQRASFTAETFPDHEFSGTVTRIAPVASIISGVVNYQVAISIARDIAMLKPDMTTNVSIRTAEHRALLVPVKSVHREGGEVFVWLRSSTGAEIKRVVATGARSGDAVEITRGLGAEEKVIVREETGKP
ncbi:MAG: efflux RND transporter periplasmic adaptor subunit [Acidobacteriaceae bacterium]